MYPARFFDLFPPHPQDDRVFVAMSFDALLDARWKQVIEPGVWQAGLRPYRVDASTISDSILTEIEQGIGTSRLVLADISLVGSTRNANVLYEVGLAHAVRQPQEVILFRSDSDRLLFDLSNVRVNRYDPDHDPTGARDSVTRAIEDARRETDLRRSLAVERAVRSLDIYAITLLMAAHDPEGIQDPVLDTIADVLGSVGYIQALPRLLDAGLLQVEWRSVPEFTPDKYPRMTDFTRKHVRYGLTRLGEATRAAYLENVLAAIRPTPPVTE